MRILLLSAIALLALHLAGCAGKPVTAEAFRQGLAEKESFEVNRPYNGVVDTFKRMATRCLDVTMTTSPSPGAPPAVANWNPAFSAGYDKAELQLRLSDNRKESAEGRLVMIVDISLVSPRRTRIEMYRFPNEIALIYRSVKNWALGKDIACPDLTDIRVLPKT